MKKIVYLVFGLFTACCAKAQCPVALNYDTSICSADNFSVTIDASVLDTSLCGDSVTIILNAANTVLAGDTNVYMLSAPQFTPFVVWGTNPYTTGSTTTNNGIGRMTSLGNNLWSITIHPQTYYNYPADTCLNGIWLVFHNYNGSVYLNSNDATRNFFVLTKTTGDAVSEIAPDTVIAHKKVGAVTYRWSDGSTINPRTFTTGGSYTVTATSVGGCTASGSVVIKTGHAPVSLGNNIIRCVPNSPVTLNAGSGFESYQWLNEPFTTNSTYTATNPGCYWILVIDSSNCTSSATVQIENTEVGHLSLPDSLNSCPGGHITMDASTNVNRLGDSIVIIYNDTSGQSELAGATKVYFHSSPEFYTGQAFQDAYEVGNWGQDDGVGEMTSLGNNLWRIAIDPYCYYKMNPDSNLAGIQMVFRNADGTQTGKNNTDNNIIVQMVGGIPVSTFSGVTASRTARQPLTYAWSNNVSGPVNTVTTANTYTVTLTDNNSCSNSASVVVTFSGTPPVLLGNDTTICPGNTLAINAPAGFSHYNWSNSDTTQSITVSTSATYSVTTTDTVGCQYFGSRKVTVDANQVSIGNNIYECSKTPVTLTATSGFTSYQWLNGTAGISTTYNAVNRGQYWIKAVDNAGCASYDTVTLQFSDVLGLSFPDTMNTCPGNFLDLDASTSIQQNGDSLLIIYNATAGQTGLIGARKVYMHSGPVFHAGGIWVGAYTVGNWGQDDGLGRMDSVGNNIWRIVIDPRDYYHLNPDTPLYSIQMVFRNADGSQTGKTGNGTNYELILAPVEPVSQFYGLSGFYHATANITYNWSIQNTASAIAVSTPGPYTVTVSDNHNCSATATVIVTNNSTLSVSLGNDTTVCAGQQLILNPGSSYNSYKWNNGDTTATINVTATGTYAVTVTSGSCSALDSVNVTVHTHQVSLDQHNILRCNTAPVTLTASQGFVSYLWFGLGTSSATYSANNPGNYWVKATDASNCVSYDTATVSNSAVLALSLPDTLGGCSAAPITADASTNIIAHGDSITIVYDVTKGLTTLNNPAKVYMHSSPQFASSPLNWQGGYTVGQWGIDNGVGEMTKTGTNTWQITIDPITYFNVPPDTVVSGIWMVFRNADGTQSGRDIGGNNILLNISTATPSSTFNGVTGTRKTVSGLTYHWSNNDTTAATTFNGNGTFSVTVSDGTCTNSDSIVVISGQSPVITITGPDTICGSTSVKLQADSGYASYVWSTGASTSFSYISASGTYQVTATNSFGCSGTGSKTVDTCGEGVVVVAGCGSPTASFTASSISPENTVEFRDKSLISKILSYYWTFGDGTSDNDVGNTVHTYANPGSYWVALVIRDSCGGVSTDSVLVKVNITGIGSVSGLSSFNIYPNPSSGIFHLDILLTEQQAVNISVYDEVGRVAWQKSEALTVGNNSMSLDASGFASGMYMLELRNNNERVIKRITITK